MIRTPDTSAALAWNKASVTGTRGFHENSRWLSLLGRCRSHALERGGEEAEHSSLFPPTVQLLSLSDKERKGGKEGVSSNAADFSRSY